VLYGDPLSAPADRMTEQGLTVALSSAHGWNLEVFSEYLDLMRFPAAQYGDDIERFLRARYETRKPFRNGAPEWLSILERQMPIALPGKPSVT
jgi:hypothetical protein